MRVIFAGTPEFARVALARLHAAGFDIPLVLTQPDRPAGRGLKLQASAVKQWAQAQGVLVAQPRSLRLEGKYPDDAATAKAQIEAARADVMVVAAYGLILPQWVLDTPRLGCLNIHASLLPRWRGAAPIHRAIEAGDAQTGVTIMQMDAGLDTGDMLLSETCAIASTDTTGSLHDKLADMGGRLIVEALGIAACGGLRPAAQPSEGVTYAHKIEKHEAALDWTLPAELLARRVRAFNPFPGAFSLLGTETIKIWRAEALPAPPKLAALAASASAQAGEVLQASEHGIDVLTGAGVLRVQQLQKPGGKPLAAADFLRGFELPPGTAFARAAAGPASPTAA
jgi:methionyl-tRNA formyltransferase